MSTIASDHWHHEWRIGRLQFGFHLYCHHHFELPDRWVFQPSFTYDRRTRKEGVRSDGDG